MSGGPSIGVLQWTALVLFVLAILKWGLKISFMDSLSRIIKELGDFCTLKVTKEAINGAAIVTSMAVIILYLFINSFGKVFSAILSPGPTDGKFAEVLVFLFMVMLFTLLCLRVCESRR